MDNKYYKIVTDILDKYPYSFYAFGSRVKGKARKLSDLDIATSEDIPGNILTHIEEDFEESELPFKVDLIELNKISESFRKIIAPDLLLIQKHKL